MPTKPYHVYALLSPLDGLVYYVGMSRQLPTRYEAHVQEARRCLHASHVPKDRKRRWLCDLLSQDQEPELAILEVVPRRDSSYGALSEAEKQARKLEAAWIARLRDAGHPLTNHGGGENRAAPDLIAAAERDRNLALSLGRTA